MAKSHQPRHEVSAQLSAYDIAKAGAAITVTVFALRPRAGKKILGTIEIGQGSFGWRAPSAKRFARKDWQAFAKFLSENM